MQSGRRCRSRIVGYPSLPVTLQAGSNFKFTVNYTASAAGNDMDSVAGDLGAARFDRHSRVRHLAPIAADPVTGNGTLNPCTLQVAPPALAFGNVTVGTPVQKSVTLTNSGDQQCSVTGIGLAAGTDAAFTLVTPATTSLTIASGQSATIAVSCDVATSGNPLLHKGALTFQSTDPSHATVSVPLTASVQGIGPYSNGWPKWHNDNTDQGQSGADTSGERRQPGLQVLRRRADDRRRLSGAGQSQSDLHELAGGRRLRQRLPAWDGRHFLRGQPDRYPTLEGEFAGAQSRRAPGDAHHRSGRDDLRRDRHRQPVRHGADVPPSTPRPAPSSFNRVRPPGLNCDPQPDCFSATDCEQIVSSTITCQGGSGSFELGTCCYTADGFDVNPSLGADGMLFDGDDIGQLVTYSLNAGGSFTQANEVLLQFYGERVAVALDGNDNSYWCSLNSCFGVTSPALGFAQMAGWPAAGSTIGNAGRQGPAAGHLLGELRPRLRRQLHHLADGGGGHPDVQQPGKRRSRCHGCHQWRDPLGQSRCRSGPTPGSFNANTGVGVFSSDVGNSAPAIDAVDGTVYVGNVDGLYALVGSTGAIKTGFPYKPSQDTGANADVDSAPAIGGDRTVFFGTAGGTFYAVNPDGSERYHYKTGGRISSSPAIGPDGTVFFVSDDGYLYAIR